jgi:thioredoxin 1
MKVLKFSATWCGPCKMLARNLEDINTNIPIENIDIDENQDVAIEYGVRGVPTMIMIDENNNQVKRMVGMQSLKDLENWFNV